MDCSGNVAVRNTSITSLTNGLFRWGVIVGGFSCNHCENLKTLEGAPKKTGGYFDCGRCDKLTSLEGAPEEVNGYFNCSGCNNLKTLLLSKKPFVSDIVSRGDFYILPHLK